MAVKKKAMLKASLQGEPLEQSIKEVKKRVYQRFICL